MNINRRMLSLRAGRMDTNDGGGWPARAKVSTGPGAKSIGILARLVEVRV